MKVDLKEVEDDLELVEIDDYYVVLFTDCRLDKTTVPHGLYYYDARHSDDGDIQICEISNNVLVNHGGTIISKEELPLDNDGSYFPKNINFIGDSCTIEDYIENNVMLL